MSSDSQSLAGFFHSKRATQLLDLLDSDNLPRHIAIIMDGNGRWAEKRGLPRLAGHSAGAKAVKEVIAASIELGIEYLSLYSFSSENWRRPADEVGGLMRLFVEVLEREMANLEKKNVRVRVIGDLSVIPDATRSSFERCVVRTSGNGGMTLVIALNYGSRVDITHAVRSIAEEVASGAMNVEAIDESTIASHLSTEGIPDPDLLVRTSGEMRVSNFMLWEIAYTELWNTRVLWPDFTRTDLLRGVVEYQGRQRRFGGV